MSDDTNDPAELRREAQADRARAAELHDDNPIYAGYLELRARHKEQMARDRDEWLLGDRR